MSDILVESPSRYTMMILVVGLFIAFGAGFVVGTQGRPIAYPQPQVASVLPANYDLAKHDQELLGSCYKVMGDWVIALRDQSSKTEQVVTTAMGDLRTTCKQKEVVITPGSADAVDAKKKQTTH